MTSAIDDSSTTTPQETLVLDLCRTLLDRPGTQLHERFVEIGGSSLVAARLLVAIEDATGIRLRAAKLLRQPDLRGIAQMLAEQQSG